MDRSEDRPDVRLVEHERLLGEVHLRAGQSRDHKQLPVHEWQQQAILLLHGRGHGTRAALALHRQSAQAAAHSRPSSSRVVDRRRWRQRRRQLHRQDGRALLFAPRHHTGDQPQSESFHQGDLLRRDQEHFADIGQRLQRLPVQALRVQQGLGQLQRARQVAAHTQHGQADELVWRAGRLHSEHQ